MKNLIELKKEIKDILDTKYDETKTIMNSDNAGYRKYGKNWATVVAVDIVGFKNLVKEKGNEEIVKLIQIFTDTLTKKAIEFTNFRDVYFAGDEVIVVFDGSKKLSITNAIDFSFYANTLVNIVINNIFMEKYKINIKAGVGVWTSSDNSLVMMGHKGGKNNCTTLIGNAINRASFLAKKANRTFGSKKYPSILMNYTTYNNVISTTKESLTKWSKKQGNEFEESIFGCSVIKTKYKDNH